MTVSVPTQLEFVSNGNGVTTSFSYPVRFLEKAELLVAFRVDGVDTVKTLGVDYTIAGTSWPSGGNVVFSTAPATGIQVVRRRNTAARQIVDLNDKTRNPAQAVEDQLDRLAMVDQDHDFLIAATMTGLLAERAARLAGDNLLGGRIDGERSERIAADNTEITNRVNGDNAVASLIGQAGGPIEVPYYDTQLAVSFSTIKNTIQTIRTGGSVAPGNGGGAIYKRVVSEPAHAGKIRSLDGAWWEIADIRLNVRAFGVLETNSGEENAARMQDAVDCARSFKVAGYPRSVDVPPGRYPMAKRFTDATGWGHCVYVYDSVRIVGDGTFVTTSAFANRTVVFVVRGDYVTFRNLKFDDLGIGTSSRYSVPIGAGTAYDSGLQSGRTYRELLVDNCEMDNSWLSASVQFISGDDGTVSFDEIEFRNCVSRSFVDTATAGNFNGRSDPPGKVRNLSMVNCKAFNGKTASSFNFVGVYRGRVSNCYSFRNLYAACEIENGCLDIDVNGLQCLDDVKGLWIDDSSRINASNINLVSLSEELVTPLLGTFKRCRDVVHITRQGFTGNTGIVTGAIAVSGISGMYGKITVGTFGSDPQGAFGTIRISNGFLSSDGVTRTVGNRGLNIENAAEVPNLVLQNITFNGWPERAISLAMSAGSTARLNNVRTSAVASEVSSGLVTSGGGKLIMLDVDVHTQNLNHTGGTDKLLYYVNGVPQP